MVKRILPGVALVVAHASVAQEVNIRTHADPETDSSVVQVIEEARLKAERANQTQNGLLANHVTNGVVSTDCNLQVGGQQTQKQAPPPSSLVGSNFAGNSKNTTVVNGATVLLCNKP